MEPSVESVYRPSREAARAPRERRAPRGEGRRLERAIRAVTPFVAPPLAYVLATSLLGGGTFALIPLVLAALVAPLAIRSGRWTDWLAVGLAVVAGVVALATTGTPFVVAALSGWLFPALLVSPLARWLLHTAGTFSS